MKADRFGAVLSTAYNTPIVSVTRGAAITACQGLGSKYDLMTNDQWQTIARNIANTNENWSSGAANTGRLNLGVYNVVSPAAVRAASLDDSIANCADTGVVCTSATWHDRRRTNTLSNGNVIWDLGGNAWEWVKDDMTIPAGVDANVSDYSGTNDVRQGPFGHTSACASPASNNYCGFGTAIVSLSGGGLFRGGYHSDSNITGGIFRSYQNTGINTTTYSSTSLGYRCVYHPSFTWSVNDGNNSSLTDSPKITWTNVPRSASFIIDLGTFSGGNDVTSVTLTGNVKEYIFKNLTLTEGVTYYATVKARDAATTIIDVQSGDGWTASNNNCPVDFVMVPSLAGYTNNNFCVSKFEMKADRFGVALSTALNIPKYSLSRTTAITNCQGLGPKYDLITNDEWQSMARNIVSNSANWSSGIAYSGRLNIGVYNATTGAQHAASDDDINGNCADTGAVCTSSSWNDRRRTHVLSNGEIVWDVGGNVAEWVKDSFPIGIGPGEFGALFSGTNDVRQALIGHTQACAAPASNSYCGYGQSSTETSGGAIYRGGHYSDSNISGGVLKGYMIVGVTPSSTSSTVGYRCVYHPTYTWDMSFASTGPLTESPYLSWKFIPGASSYEIAIGTTIGGVEVVNWLVFNGETNQAFIKNLNLTDGTTYYVTIRARDPSTNIISTHNAGSWTASIGSCPANFVLAPALAGFTSADFCVAKFEMKTDRLGVPTSTAYDVPKNSISRNTAITNCQSLGNKYDLITNDEWQSVARNLASTNINWSSGSAHVGRVNIGVHNVVTGNAHAAAFDDTNGNCSDTGTLCSSSTWNDRRRTNVLSNGSIIWDFGGNLAEFVKDDFVIGIGLDAYSAEFSGVYDVRQSVAGDALACASPSSNNYCAYGQSTFTQTGGALFRGGNYTDSNLSGGVFKAYTGAGITPTMTSGSVGYRCVYHPTYTWNFDDGTTSSLTESPRLTWSNVPLSNSFVINIGTTPGGADVTTTTLSGHLKEYTFKNLTLIEGNTYYASIIVKNAAAAVIDTKDGDGWIATVTSCPNNFSMVPALPGYTASDFCVAKFEMKNDRYNNPLSSAYGLPVASLNRAAAITKCQSLGANYDLVTNNEWQAMARNVAGSNSNWSSGTAYSGRLNVGIYNAVGVVQNGSEDEVNGNCAGTGATCTNVVWNEKRRTSTFSNGSIVWDLSGNLGEWIKDSNSTSQGADGYAANFTASDSRQINYGAETSEICASPSSNTYCGYGYGMVNYAGGGIYRGSSYQDTVLNAGIFYTNLNVATSSSTATIGYRCSYHP
jgi:hypothetical protein